MCRSRRDPDGPRTCPGDAGKAYGAAQGKVADLRELEARLQAQLDDALTQRHPVISDIRRWQACASATHQDLGISSGDDEALRRVGLHCHGAPSADDYPIIAERGGDLAAWGFVSRHGGDGAEAATILTSDIGAVTARNASFVAGLSSEQRAAAADYTTSNYKAINTTFTGVNARPSEKVAATVAHLRSTFADFVAHNPNEQAMIVTRGTVVPRTWTGSTDDYLATVFRPGTKVGIGQIASCSTSTDVADHWSGQPPLVMVIKTHEGLPLKALSDHSGEDEVVLPPGAQLRCVRVDRQGIGGKPTVYLVADSLVAEEQSGIDRGIVAPRSPRVRVPSVVESGPAAGDDVTGVGQSAWTMDPMIPKAGFAF